MRIGGEALKSSMTRANSSRSKAAASISAPYFQLGYGFDLGLGPRQRVVQPGPQARRERRAHALEVREVVEPQAHRRDVAVLLVVHATQIRQEPQPLEKLHQVVVAIDEAPADAFFEAQRVRLDAEAHGQGRAAQV